MPGMVPLLFLKPSKVEINKEDLEVRKIHTEADAENLHNI